ncbi:MAG: HAD hydrolase family protein, partial [Ilumatobacter sp.]|nr:HAD hydrolase family protein [Ilumatobacter sp.]MCB0983288.1 HAD hydrolase family protein [Ilumatobacter sp.]
MAAPPFHSTDRSPSRALPRLIATDLDGTLLDPMGGLSPRTAAALQAAADAGIIVVFATGRPPTVAVAEVTAAGHGVHYGVMAN